MSRSEPHIDVESLLENARAVRPVPDAVRERALARARAAAKTAAAPLQALSAAPPRWSLRAIALAAALAVGVASASFAVGSRWSQAPARAVPTAPRAIAPKPALPPAIPERASPAAPPESPRITDSERAQASSATLGSARPNRAAQPQSSASETDLLRRAHAAYASREFASALLLVAEHARRFPSGVLAEEREALRVRSLAGAGRTSEARHAAEMFGKRFPRSVLLPRIQKIGEAE